MIVLSVPRDRSSGPSIRGSTRRQGWAIDMTVPTLNTAMLRGQRTTNQGIVTTAQRSSSGAGTALEEHSGLLAATLSAGSCSKCCRTWAFSV